MIHLQAMVQILRPCDTISIAVRLCSYSSNKIRYLVVVEASSNLHKTSSNEETCEESAILGLDLFVNSQQADKLSGKLDDNENSELQELPVCKMGLVLPIYGNGEINLNGDVEFHFKTHFYKFNTIYAKSSL